jgi:hypothetical protein
MVGNKSPAGRYWVTHHARQHLGGQCVEPSPKPRHCPQSGKPRNFRFLQEVAPTRGPVQNASGLTSPEGRGDNSINGTIDAGPEAQYNIRVLERATARNSDGASAGNALHPYDGRVLPGDAEIRQIAESFGSRVQGFGLRPGLLAADVERFGFLNGVLSDGFMDRGLQRDMRFYEVLVPRHC